MWGSEDTVTLNAVSPGLGFPVGIAPARLQRARETIKDLDEDDSHKKLKASTKIVIKGKYKNLLGYKISCKIHTQLSIYKIYL